MMIRILLLMEKKNNTNFTTHNIAMATTPSLIAKIPIIQQIPLILSFLVKAHTSKVTQILITMILAVISNHRLQIQMKLGMNMYVMSIERM